MINKIDHVVITTAKIDECLAFYKALGFSVKDSGGRYELFTGDFKINVHIKDHELSPHAENVQTGSADMCFEITDNINDVKAQLQANGVEIELGVVPRTGAMGTMQSIYMRDPDGNLIELCAYE